MYKLSYRLILHIEKLKSDYSKRLILFLWILISSDLSAQVVFSGKITNSKGQPIESASITLKAPTGNIVAFCISDNRGYYKVIWKQTETKDLYSLEAASVGYAKKALQVPLASSDINFELLESFAKLPEVKVGNNRPIRKEGDTLNYDVKTFSASQDRVIGDVIKKLPGIQVAENGQISFAGKPINRFYIDGDNLLDGRYNVATQTIPNDIISKVQILQEHQPLNILKGFERSDQAALNLVTNQKSRSRPIISGDATIGLPDAFGLSTNTMLFKSKVKFINYFRINNIGLDNTDDFINHFSSSENSMPTLLNAGISSPDIPKRRYLFNNTGTATLNDMLTLQNEIQLRINLFYNWDRVTQSFTNTTYNFLPADTIRYSESQKSINNKNAVTTQVTLTANKNNYYLNEELSLENTPNDFNSAILSNSGNPISQQVSGSVTSFTNKTAILKKTKSGLLLEGSSNFTYTHNPSSLYVEPGVYKNFINTSQPYDGLLQNASLPTLYTDNYISTGVASGNFQQRYKVGFSYQNQELNSQLETLEGNQIKRVLSDSFVNNIKWERLRSYFKPDFTITGTRSVFSISFPITFQKTIYLQNKSLNTLPILLFEPKFSLKFIIGKDAYINLAYGYEHIFGGINQVYNGFIMRNYRSFYANDSILNNSRKQSASLNYTFKNILQVLFIQAGGSFSKSKNNTINDNLLNSLFQRGKVSAFLNYSNTLEFYASISKYLSQILTTFTGRTSWQDNRSDQLQNGVLLPIRSNSWQYSINMNSKIIPRTNFDYTVTSFNAVSKIQSDLGYKFNTPQTMRWQHRLAVNVSLSENTYLKTSAEYGLYTATNSSSNKSSYFFSDASFVYKINKWRTDVEFGVTNISNAYTYRTVYLIQNTLTENTYALRPRMFVGKINFRF